MGTKRRKRIFKVNSADDADGARGFVKLRMKFPSWRNVVCAHMMEDMLLKKGTRSHDPVCDLVTEYRAMM